MKRRRFLQTTALAASGLAWPWAHTSHLLAAAGAQDSLEVALIGVGYQGRVLLNAVRQLPGVHVRALCDIWEYARNYGQNYLKSNGNEVAAYADFEELLDKEAGLDAVLIASPDFAHAPQALACLEKGLHVYCEPMLAHSLDAARNVVQAATRSGKLLQVGYQRRSDPRYQHARERLLREAELTGRLTALQTQWAQEAEPLRGWPRRYTVPQDVLARYGYADMNQFRNWMWYPPYSSGPFCDFVAHQIDVCQWFVDAAPQAVLASGGNDYYPDRANLDTVLALFEFPRPADAGAAGVLRASCNMYTTTSAGGMRQYERFLGAEGSIQISSNPRWTRIGREPSAKEWDEWVRKQYLVKPEVVAAHAAEDDATEVHVSGELEVYQLPELGTLADCGPHLANFFAAIRGTEQLACPGDVAWASHVAAFKTLEAVQSRQAVALTASDYQH
jgi:predicted dehydrogenase